jgi:phage portal protein BeeE
MSRLSPLIYEVMGDKAATAHKLKFYENAATANLMVKSEFKDAAAFEKFVDTIESKHKGVSNAYRTMYLMSGMDAKVLGADMVQMDFKAVQGATETRIAAAFGVPPVIAGFSEGLQGSSLNTGNYSAARRRFSDLTIRPLWRNFCGSLESIVPPPSGAQLWYDDRDIAFLREDAKDRAEIAQTQAATIRQLVDAGYLPESVVKAVLAEDYSLLKHSGLFSVQLQPPMPDGPPEPVDVPAEPTNGKTTMPMNEVPSP